jgi:mono/diheme cytochrome c family protein
MRLAMAGLVMTMASRASIGADPAQSQSPAADRWRAAVMQHHFVAISTVHEAVIRGDLRGVLPPAAALAAMRTPTGLPIDAEPYAERIRAASRRAGTAPNLRTAAAATVTMLQQCAACHRAAGIYPAPVATRRPDIGGIVGHMLGHLEAVDELLLGLVVPSDSLWESGADRLRTATLNPREWPRDPKLTTEARQADAAVHALADRAKAATTADARAAVYVDLLTTCASCHSLHRGSWGPRTTVPGR